MCWILGCALIKLQGRVLLSPMIFTADLLCIMYHTNVSPSGPLDRMGRKPKSCVCQ
jgi:hypothetical protein